MNILKIEDYNHETVMSNEKIRIFIKTIVISLFVASLAGAQELESEVAGLISGAFSEPVILSVPIEECPSFYQERSENEPEEYELDIERLIDHVFWQKTPLPIPIEEHTFFYHDLSEDENYSSELREYAGKMYRLSVIRKKMLNLVQGIHDQKSAESAVEQILEYDKEVAGLDTRQTYIKAKGKTDGIEPYLLSHLYHWDKRDTALFFKEMWRCIKEKNLYRYKTLKRELNPRLNSPWNLALLLPSFYVSMESSIAAYKEIQEDSSCSVELKGFVDRWIKLNDIREKMLEALSKIHDMASAIECEDALTRYIEEIRDLDMLRYYIEIKDKLSKEEEKILKRLLRWRHDETTAFISRYLRIWEEKGLENYGDEVRMFRKFFLPYNQPLWIDYMDPSYNRSDVKIEKSVRELIDEIGNSYFMYEYPMGL